MVVYTMYMEQLRETNEKTTFEQKRTKYFSSFAQHHLQEMRILQLGGVFGKENKEWRNVAEHCIVEAVAADVLAEALGGDRQKIVQAVLLHDWFKRHEVEEIRRRGAVEGYAKTSAEDVHLLSEIGIVPEVIRLAHANILDSLDHDYLSQRTLEEQIVHFIDAVTRNTELVSIPERFDALEQRQQNIEFSNSFMNQYHGQSLYTVQRDFAQAEQDAFEQQLNIEKGKLLDFVKESIKKRITTQDLNRAMK